METVMNNIKTLVKDMEDTILGLKGWDNLVGLGMGDAIAKSANNRFSKPQKPRGYLSFSAIGSPCQRKLWYKINETNVARPNSASDLLKFFYGDMIEELVLAIVKVSGHEVTGEQDRMYINGLAGSRDAVIDGMTVDVKSASPYSFKKFAEGNLREQDPFGYISQLSSYVYAAKDDPLVTNKTHGAFLVVDKVGGGICLDVYDFTPELEKKEKEVDTVKEMVKGSMPERGYEAVPQSKTSPNTKLPMSCGFCEFNKKCWPEARRFVYKTGDVLLVDVVTTPNVPEDLTYNEQKEV
tara:strand:- start:1459 stop:2343 length:885 start_codon:yes stop_codon:yes gene_type:complete